MAERADVLIVGGGVVGASIAWALASRGVTGIAGRVGSFDNLFEAHSFTGRGVMQSYAVGCEMAALIATGRFETCDLSALTRERFENPARWVREELHI